LRLALFPWAASLTPKKYVTGYFSVLKRTSKLQNIPEAAPKASPSFSVCERLARLALEARDSFRFVRAPLVVAVLSPRVVFS
jgi:hypothetical protein